MDSNLIYTLGKWCFNADTVLISAIISFSILGLCFFISHSYCSKKKEIINTDCNYFQAAFELSYDFIRVNVFNIFGRNHNWASALLFTALSWIVSFSLIDLIPHSTGNVVASLIGAPHFSFALLENHNICIALSLAVLINTLLISLSNRGLKGFLQYWTSRPFNTLAFPGNILFNFIEEVLQPCILGVRIFANAWAGVMLNTIIRSLPIYIYPIFQIVWSTFHFLIMMLQGFTFLKLCFIYLLNCTHKINNRIHKINNHD